MEGHLGGWVWMCLQTGLLVTIMGMVSPRKWTGKSLGKRAKIGAHLLVSGLCALIGILLGLFPATVLVFVAVSELFVLALSKMPRSRVYVRAASLEVLTSGAERNVVPLDLNPRVEAGMGGPLLMTSEGETLLKTKLSLAQIAGFNRWLSRYIEQRNHLLEREGHDLSVVAKPPDSLMAMVDSHR
jgi:hypothetical protein